MMKRKIIFGLFLCAVLSVTGIYSAKDVKATGIYTTEQIKEYITAKEAPPTQEGKIFAGWYNGETPVKNETEVTDTTVAKFVDDDVLTVKFQLLATTGKDDTTTDVRFLTSVDSLNYKSVEFEVTLNKTVTTPVNKVYTSVNAEGEKFTPNEVFSEDSNYIATLLMTDFTKDAETEGDYGYWGQTIKVTPMWTTMDGTTVTGKMRQLEVNDGLYDTEVNSGDKRTWHTLEEGFSTAAASSEDVVTLDILQDVERTNMSQIAINDTTSKTITVNGGGHTLDLDGNTASTFAVVKPYGKFVINDVTIIHEEDAKGAYHVFAFGKDTTYVSGTNLQVEFKGVTINSNSSNTYALINVQKSQSNSIKMTDTKIIWNNSGFVAANQTAAAIRMNHNAKKPDALEMNNCTIDVEQYGFSGIFIGWFVQGNIKLNQTTINTEGTSNVTKGEVVTPGKVAQYTYEEVECTLNNPTYGYVATTTVGETVNNHRSLYDAINNTMNKATSDVTLTLLGDVTSYLRHRLGTSSSYCDVTIDGANHKLTVLASGDKNEVFLMDDASYTLTLKDINIEHSGAYQLFRIGNATKANLPASPNTLSLVMSNVDIHSTSANRDTLINLHDNQVFSVTMNDVHINWENDGKLNENAAVVRFGNPDQQKKVIFTMTNSSITSSTAGISGLYIPNAVLEGSSVQLTDSSITTDGETPLYIKDDAASCEITGITQ